jgi:hypothetical protein
MTTSEIDETKQRAAQLHSSCTPTYCTRGDLALCYYARALLAEAAENARLRKLIEIADVLITNENAIEDWNNAKQTRVM